MTLEIPLLGETAQLEDAEELDSADDLDQQEELDCQSDSSDDEEAEEVTPGNSGKASAPDETVTSSRSVKTVEEPVSTIVEEEVDGKEDPIEDCITPVEIRLEELELDAESKGAEQAQLETLDEVAITADIAVPSIEEQLVETVAETDGPLECNEPSETLSNVAEGTIEGEFNFASLPRVSRITG